MWTIAENLHRSGLSKLERAESIANWKRLLKKLSHDGHNARPGGHQPKDKGVSKTAKALDLSREDVRRSDKVATICNEAKRLAAQKGLDDNQAALLKVAAEPTPKAQVRKVRELAKKAEVKRSSPLSPDDTAHLKLLKGTFKGATKFKKAWSQASIPVRRKFAAIIMKRPTKNAE
jgi:hypothetical protein